MRNCAARSATRRLRGIRSGWSICGAIRIERNTTMTYDYIKDTYGVSPEPGKVVYHTVTKQWGVIKRESKSASHYVQVTFEGCKHASPCHPTELQYDLPDPT
jgi:hypothetical protein